jgi:HSP20 family protein
MTEKEFSNRLKELRKEMELTQQELAEILDISRQSLSNLEKGLFFPSFALILELENFFRLPIREIYKTNNINNKQAPLRSRFESYEGQGGKMDKNYSPFDELNRMREEFDNMFSDSFSQIPANFPKINLYQDEANLVIEAEVPGMSKNDLEINLTSDSLSISGEKKESQEVKEDNYVRKESSFGKFHRNVDLPVEVDDAKAKATIKDGRVKIMAPIKKETEKEKKGLEIEEEK